MEALTLNKAMELYELLGTHTPEVDDADDSLEFIGKITSSIVESEQHKDYTDAIMLMSDIKWEELKVLESDEVLELFVDGLSANRIVSLKVFCNKVGFGYA